MVPAKANPRDLVLNDANIKLPPEGERMTRPDDDSDVSERKSSAAGAAAETLNSEKP
jgi:hypothetical protein